MVFEIIVVLFWIILLVVDKLKLNKEDKKIFSFKYIKVNN